MEIMEKLGAYTSEHDYAPLKICMKLKSPLYLNTPWINLDSIINMLCFRDALGEDFYNLPTNKTIRYDDLDTPLKKTDDVFHASVGKFNPEKVFIDTMFKRFTDKEAHKLSSKGNRSKVRVNSGYFKDYIIQLPAVLTEEIIFYCCADKDNLKYLLNNLKQLGKKTSIGGGRIQKIIYTDTEVDYSFYKDEEIMRSIPFKLIKHFPMIPGTTGSIQNYKPPYWDKSNVTMCLTPPNQLKEVLKHA
jgi:CRISPR type IV-associated protein Csf3